MPSSSGSNKVMDASILPFDLVSAPAPAAAPNSPRGPPRFPLYSSTTIYDLESAQKEIEAHLADTIRRTDQIENKTRYLENHIMPAWANNIIYGLLFIKDTCFAICILILYFKTYHAI